MRHKKPRLGWFASPIRRALDYERDLHVKKILECMDVKEENEKLWDLCQKQRIAIAAFRQEHAEEMEKMNTSLSEARAQLASVTAERDRYRNALRRLFPAQNQEAAG